MYGSKIAAVQPEIINLDQERMADELLEKSIRITEVESFNRKGEKIWNGLQSEFFGTDFGDDNAFLEKFSCKCGKYIGEWYKGKFCESCKTYVGFQDIDLTRFGWIILDHFKIIHPLYYMKLKDCLGTSDGEYVLDKILCVKYEDEDDKLEPKEKDILEAKKHPFMHKGMYWLSNHLDDVIQFYKKKKPTKKALFEEIENGFFDVFCHSLPVYSAAIRTEIPGEKGGKAYKMKINTCYRAIIRNVNYVNKFTEEDIDDRKMISINSALAAIQKEIVDIFNISYKEMTSKKGIIMTKVIGGRYNFSARNIIVCSSGRLRADEIELGYLTFGELFRYEIINLYSKMMQCNPKTAADALEGGLEHFDPNIYKIMQYLVSDKKYNKNASALISRNPCINIGSFDWMRIAKVKDTLEDKTMTIPSTICNPTNADFDGDMMNIYRVMSEYFNAIFSKTLNPRYNLMVSRMDGQINKECVPMKNEAVGFWAFNNL